MPEGIKKKRGGALISALFITAIAAVLAVALIMEQRLIIHEGELIIGADQSYLNLDAMVLFAKNRVKMYASQWDNDSMISPDIRPLKNKLPKVIIGNETITGDIEDEQGKFNVNELVYTANQPLFAELLQSVVQGMSKRAAYAIAQAVTAWISNNTQDPYYLSLHPPYRAPQHEMANISELRLVNGVTTKIYTALFPYVTALPIKKETTQQLQAAQHSTDPHVIQTATKINVNSAQAPVLRTLDPAMSLSQAKEIVACRQSNGFFTNLNDFVTTCAKQFGINLENNTTVQSHFFMVHIQAVSPARIVTMKSLLVTRKTKNNKLVVTTVWQSFE